MTAYNVLFLGASYGSLLATKLLFAGHKVTLVAYLPSKRLSTRTAHVCVYR